MYLDGENLFSENQAITATAVSENIIDTSVARDIGTGENLYISLTVTETLDDSGDDSTIAVTLITDDDEQIGSPDVIRSLVTLPANAPAGTQLYFKLEPENLVTFKRYLALNYTVANGNLSAGKLTAGLVRNIQKSQNYPASGFSVY